MLSYANFEKYLQDLTPASTSSPHFQASSEFNVEDYVNEGKKG